MTISMKFKVGNKVRKVSGYRFDGTVIAAFKNTVGQIRYSVQVDATEARRLVQEMSDACSFTEEMTEQLTRWVSNCDGMIHIFSEEQLALRELV